jgi:hypothetical protein
MREKFWQLTRSGLLRIDTQTVIKEIKNIQQHEIEKNEKPNKLKVIQQHEGEKIEPKNCSITKHSEFECLYMSNIIFLNHIISQILSQPSKYSLSNKNLP